MGNCVSKKTPDDNKPNEETDIVELSRQEENQAQLASDSTKRSGNDEENLEPIPKPLPVEKNTAPEEKQKVKARVRGIKQTVSTYEGASLFPGGIIEPEFKVDTVIPANCLSFIGESALDVENQAQYIWKIISSNYEEEDSNISLETCREALSAVFAYKGIIGEWIEFEKEYFCISKSEFIRIYVALSMLDQKISIIRENFTASSLENDVWNILEFINCQRLVEPAENTQNYDLGELVEYFKEHYKNYPWLLKLVSIEPAERTSQVMPVENLSFMLSRIEIIDDVHYLALLLLNLSSTFSEPLDQFKALIGKIFGTSQEFLNYLIQEFPTTEQQGFEFIELFYFSHIKMDTLQYYIESGNQQELFRILRIEESTSTYDVTSMILSQKYPNLKPFLNFSQYSTQRRLLENLSAQSRTAQIVYFPPLSLQEFAEIREPIKMYNFACALCEASELPISQAVNLLESAFGQSEQIRLLASLVSSSTDLVLEHQDFVAIFQIFKTFSQREQYDYNYLYVVSKCQLDIELNELDLEMTTDFDSVRQQICQCASGLELLFLVDIMQGNYKQMSNSVSSARILANVQSQDHLDDCIEPFLQIIESADLQQDQLCTLFERLFGANPAIQQKLRTCKSRDNLSVLFVVAFYKSLNISPLMHAIQGDEFDCDIANSLLEALGYQPNMRARNIEEYKAELQRLSDKEPAALFCD